MERESTLLHVLTDHVHTFVMFSLSIYDHVPCCFIFLSDSG